MNIDPTMKCNIDSTWKWMVGKWVSFWDGLLSGAMLVFGRVHYDDALPCQKFVRKSLRVYTFLGVSFEMSGISIPVTWAEQTAPWKRIPTAPWKSSFSIQNDHMFHFHQVVSQHLMLMTTFPAKWTNVHRKGTIWKIWFIFQKSIFRGHLSFQGGHHFREISSLGKNTTWQATNQPPSPSLAAVRKGDAHEKAEGMSATLSGSTAVLVPLALTSSIIMTMGSPDPPCRKASLKEMSFTTMHFQVLY